MTTAMSPHEPPAFGYRIDHIPAAQRCCDMHNVNCEPLGELCCDGCAEAHHYRGLEHSPCVLDWCDCSTEQQHLDATKPGWGNRIGMREPQ